MNTAFVFDDDPRVRGELCRVIETSGWVCQASVLAEGVELLKRKGNSQLRAVFVSLSEGLPAEIVETARLVGPGAFVVAIADLDRRPLLDRALADGLADDFIPLPFSKGDVAGVMKLIGGNA
jgi:hypothetical protein